MFALMSGLGVPRGPLSGSPIDPALSTCVVSAPKTMPWLGRSQSAYTLYVSSPLVGSTAGGKGGSTPGSFERYDKYLTSFGHCARALTTSRCQVTM